MQNSAPWHRPSCSPGAAENHAQTSICLPAPRASQHSLAGLKPLWGRNLALLKAIPSPLYQRRRHYQSYKLHHPSRQCTHARAAAGIRPHRKRCVPSAPCPQLPSPVPPGVARRLDRGARSWHSDTWLRSGAAVRGDRILGCHVPGELQLPAQGGPCSRWQVFVSVCECGEELVCCRGKEITWVSWFCLLGLGRGVGIAC